MATKFDIDLGIKDEETYSISNKSIKFDSKLDIEPYLTEMEKIPTLKKIDFAGNTIGIEASELLAKSLLKFKDSIIEINFADLFTGRLKDEIPQALEHLFPSLLQMPNLRVLNLSDNAFGLQTIDPIEAFLNEAVSLEHLILSNNGMGPFAGERIGKSLYRLAQNKSKSSNAPSSLKTFYCGRNRLENGSINYLAIGLRAHKDLESIRLYQNGIRPEGISKLISKGLKHNTKLKVFDLQDNTFTIKGSTALADSLSSWKFLEEINVNDCLLNPKGSLLFINSLSLLKIDSLKLLKLQYNELDSSSLAKLASSLSNFPNLKNIELDGNRFAEDDDAIATITETLESRGGNLDDLEDLEEPDSDEDEDESEDEDEEDDADIDLDQLEKELSGLSIDEDDKEVDELASDLKKSQI